MTIPASNFVNAALAAYLPSLQLRLLSRELPSGEDRPVFTFHGAVLLVDISGFTGLIRQFEQRGKADAEEISGILREYFGKLSEIVLQYGGDVIAFAGDSALAIWPATNQGALVAPVVSSLQAALAIHRAIGSDPRIGRGILQHRSAISAGTLNAIHLGGADGKWQFLVAGGPLQEAGAVIRQISMANLAMTGGSWAMIAESNAVGREPGDFKVLDPLSISVSPPPGQTPATPLEPGFPLNHYVPAFVSERVMAGLDRWLSEFRTITTLFIGFADSDDACRPEALARLQPAVRKIQELLQRFEGSIYQFLMDDKGLVMIGIFGLPPRAHEDDPLRGVRAAVAIEAALSSMGIQTTIGVATGSSFCGIYGSHARRQYTALGTALNTAARIMQFGAGGVLCDESAAVQAQKRGEIRFEQSVPLQVKGSNSPILTYRPAAPAAPWVVADSVTQSKRPLHAGLVGRVRERKALLEALEALRNIRQKGLVILEGEAGIGKSRLLDELLTNASDLRVAHLSGAGFAIEKSVPYHAWRRIFGTVLGLSSSTESLPRQRQRVSTQLHDKPELVSLVPLLNAVLPIEFAETEVSSQLQGEARAEATRHLLLRILGFYAAGEPLVLVLDDAHWFDSVSWTLARVAAEQLPATLCVLAMRPLETPPSEYENLLKLPLAQHFHLDALSPQDGLQLACLRLGAKTVLQPIADYLTRQTEGNPLFIEELVSALRDGGAIEVRGPECRLGPRMADSSKTFEQLFSELRLPGTVQGVITASVDRLSQQEQLLIKVASVIGQGLSLAVLRDVYPIETERATVPAMADRLQERELFRRMSDESYEFRHALIQEVVYDAIPFAARRELHKNTAEYYERIHAGNLQSYYPLLAHHWSLAKITPKATEYLALAGSQALQDFANLEAVRFLSQVVALDREFSPSVDEDAAIARTRRAHWQFQLGSAYVAWSKYEEARDHLERGLALAGHPMASSVVSTSLSLFLQMLRQMAIRMKVWKLRVLPREECEKFLEMARAYEGLMEIYFLTDRPVPCLYSVFRSLNLAEKAGPSPELARCYSSTAALVGFMTMRRLANVYFRLASEAARQTADATAEAWVAMTRGFYLTGLGDCKGAREQLQRSLEIYDRLGDSRHGDDARATLAGSCHLHCNFVESQELAARVYSSALLRRDTRVQAEATRWRAYNLTALNRLDDAQSAILELDALRSSTMNLGGAHRKQDVSILNGLLSLKRGSYQVALEQARIAERRMRKLADTFDLVMERAGVVEIYLTLWECGQLSTTELRSEAAGGVKALGKYASIFPVGKPAALYWTGRLLSLRGRRKRALECWRKACGAAESLGIPIYEALAHHEIGRQLPEKDSSRELHLNRARAILESLGLPPVTIKLHHTSIAPAKPQT